MENKFYKWKEEQIYFCKCEVCREWFYFCCKEEELGDMHTKLLCDGCQAVQYVNVRVIGDHIIKFCGRICVDDGMLFEFIPGLKVKQLERYISQIGVEQREKVLIIHVGTNDIGWMKSVDHLVGDFWDLCVTAKRIYPNSKIIISGVIKRRDMEYGMISYLNKGLKWVCEKQKVIFLDGNMWIHDEDLGQNGVRLNRSGTSKLGSVFKNAIVSLMTEEN